MNPYYSLSPLFPGGPVTISLNTSIFCTKFPTFGMSFSMVGGSNRHFMHSPIPQSCWQYLALATNARVIEIPIQNRARSRFPRFPFPPLSLLLCRAVYFRPWDVRLGVFCVCIVSVWCLVFLANGEANFFSYLHSCRVSRSRMSTINLKLTYVFGFSATL